MYRSHAIYESVQNAAATVFTLYCILELCNFPLYLAKEALLPHMPYIGFVKIQSINVSRQQVRECYCEHPTIMATINKAQV